MNSIFTVLVGLEKKIEPRLRPAKRTLQLKTNDETVLALCTTEFGFTYIYPPVTEKILFTAFLKQKILSEFGVTENTACLMHFYH